MISIVVTPRRHHSTLIRLVLLYVLLNVPAFAQSAFRTIHVFVALADNKNQGIVPVPAKLGNGEDPERNLYWGSAYGVKTFFVRSAEWELMVSREKPKAEVLERCVFKHRTSNVYLVADAYRGSQIRQTIVDFLEAAAGANSEKITVKAGSQIANLEIRGGSNLVAYVGHDGFMDFQLSSWPQKTNDAHRQAIILACVSKTYFAASLRASGAQPLLWTTGLMAPEAYTLKSAIDGWILNESSAQIRERAAAAYHKYQNCGLNAARRLMATGW
jgi:hypothetical protein